MFKLTVVISAFLLATCLGAVPRIRRPHLDGRIVGGVNASISEVPYQLSLEYQGKHICGAAIIHEGFAVTAALCVEGLSTDLIRLRAGSSMRESGGTLHPAEEVFIHPDFDISSMDYDAAIVTVSVPFEFGENVLPIPIASLEPAPGTMALVSGWGSEYLGGDLPSQLQKVMVPIVDHDKCYKIYSIVWGITENMICAGEEEGGKGACLGDLGSPLVVGEELVGIASWGTNCGTYGYPGIYTNLPALSQQLRKMLRNHPRFNFL